MSIALDIAFFSDSCHLHLKVLCFGEKCMKWILAFVALGIANGPSLASDKSNKTASVNGKILERDVVLRRVVEWIRENLEGSSKELSNEEKMRVFNVMLEQSITDLIILDAAERSGIEKDPNFKESLKETTSKLLIKFFLMHHKENIEKSITPLMVQEEAKSLKEYWISWEMMSVKAKKTAEEIKKAVEKNGAKFSLLAKKYAENGKVEERKEIESLLKSNSKKLFSLLKDLKSGEIALVDLKNEFILLHLLEKKPIREQKILEAIAQKQLVDQKFKAFMKELLDSAKVLRFDAEGKVLPDPALEDPAKEKSEKKPAA
jgi:hypothetical protein